MRRRVNIYTIPAHSALVAAVKYVEGRECIKAREERGGWNVCLKVFDSGFVPLCVCPHTRNGVMA